MEYLTNRGIKLANLIYYCVIYSKV